MPAKMSHPADRPGGVCINSSFLFLHPSIQALLKEFRQRVELSGI